MKKAILSTLLLSTIFVGAASVNAAEDAENAAERSATTDVTVDLKKDEVSDQNVPGVFKDTLAIVYKPTAFKFSGYTTGNSLSLMNKHEYKNDQYIAVNDDRKDSEGKYLEKTSWTLNGQLSDITNETTVLASSLSLKPTALKTYNIGSEEIVENGTNNYKPAAIDYAGASAAEAGYTAVEAPKLVAGGDAVNIITAKDAVISSTDSTNRGVVTGLGDKAQLDIAAGAEIGSYAGTITWTLASGL